MEVVLTIIEQDLKVAKKAVEDEDFNLVNIIGNRIMTDLQTFNKNDIMLLGWFVKELGGELLSLKQKKNDKLDDAKEYAKAYLNDLEFEVANGVVESKVYWEKFFDIENKLKKNFLSDQEIGIYDDQVEFSKHFAIKMLELFYNHKNMLLVENNTLSITTANELSRNFNEHNGIEALIIYLVLRAFDNYYRYLYYEKFFIKDEDAIRCTEIKLNEYVENIYKLRYLLESSDINSLYNESNTIIGRLGADYRLYFLIYYDYSRIYAQDEVKEERIELSQETKQKLGDAIMQSLKKTS